MRFAPALPRTVHAFLSAALFSALLALMPAPAHASGAPSFNGEGVGQLLLATDVAVFGAIDVVFLASERPMPIWVSIMQIAIGGAIGPYLVISGAESTELKLAAGASALWFTGHGIYNIAVYPKWRRERVRERERLRELERLRDLNYGVAVEPRAEGAVLHVYARL